MSWKEALRNTWLFPRYIGLVYIRPALVRSRVYAKGVMVDIGCGLRPYEAIFADRVTAYIGIDWPVLSEKARPNVIGDALNLPLANATADTVMAIELMEHLPNPSQFLQEAARVLRVGGVLILSVPFLEPLHEEPRDYYRFTPYSLRLMFERHGFSVEQIWRRGGWWAVTLGSFVNQALYDWANPVTKDGQRRGNVLGMVLVAPFCTLAQWLGYTLDRFLSNKSSKYTLGYVIVATLVR